MNSWPTARRFARGFAAYRPRRVSRKFWFPVTRKREPGLSARAKASRSPKRCGRKFQNYPGHRDNRSLISKTDTQRPPLQFEVFTQTETGGAMKRFAQTVMLKDDPEIIRRYEDYHAHV